MNKKKVAALLSLSLCFSLLQAEDSLQNIASEKINKLQIVYLAQSKDYKKSINLYKQYKLQNNEHDFDILAQMTQAMLETGSRSSDPQIQLLSIYASSFAGVNSAYDILEAGISSQNMYTQLGALQFLARMQDDYIDRILQKAMNSEFLYTRLEAAYILAARKSASSTGQVEALMHKLPPQMRFFFPELFAMIGTPEAISSLKHLMDDSFHATRVEAILSAAKHGRDDLLPMIRSSSTHINIAEQEACATALGHLKDSKSIKRLKKLSQSPSDNVQLASMRSLIQLGDDSVKESIIEKAKEKNLFAIAMLSEIEGSEDLLFSLLSEEQLSIKLNATLSLLRRKDPRVLPFLKEFLVRDSRDIGYQINSSIGNSLRAWKVITSIKQHAKQSPYDLYAISLSLKESILRDALEIGEDAFIDLARQIIDLRQNELIPLVVSLLENLKTPKAIELLKLKSQTAGAPLIRTYCCLSLFRLKEQGPYEEVLTKWVQSRQSHEIIQFRPSLPWASRSLETNFELTPEENSALLIEIFQVLAEKHDEKTVDFLLDCLLEADSTNLPVLSGILLKAIQ